MLSVRLYLFSSIVIMLVGLILSLLMGYTTGINYLEWVLGMLTRVTAHLGDMSWVNQFKPWSDILLLMIGFAIFLSELQIFWVVFQTIISLAVFETNSIIVGVTLHPFGRVSCLLSQIHDTPLASAVIVHRMQLLSDIDKCLSAIPWTIAKIVVVVSVMGSGVLSGIMLYRMVMEIIGTSSNLTFQNIMNWVLSCLCVLVHAFALSVILVFVAFVAYKLGRFYTLHLDCTIHDRIFSKIRSMK